MRRFLRTDAVTESVPRFDRIGVGAGRGCDRIGVKQEWV